MSLLEKFKKPNQADLLSLQLKEVEKAVDPTKRIDPATFMLRHQESMAIIDHTIPDKDKTKTKLKVIKEEKEKILTYDWTGALSATRMFLKMEQDMLENLGIDPDMVETEAYKEEAKYLENDPYNPIKRALSKQLQDKAKKLEKQVSKRLQKTSVKETIFNKITKKLVR